MADDYETGDLDRAITLIAPLETKPGYQRPGAEPPTQATVPGSIEPLSGRDLVFAQQSQSLATHRIIIRWREGIRSDWQLQCEGRLFQIDGIPLEIGRRRFLKIMCIEKE